MVRGNWEEVNIKEENNRDELVTFWAGAPDLPEFKSGFGRCFVFILIEGEKDDN